MVPIAFALLCAASYGVTSISVQLALKNSRLTALQGMIINLLVANVTLGTALAVSLAVRPIHMDRNGVLWFIAAGLMGPLLARGLNYQAIRHVGATRAQSLSNAESLFAGPLAFFLLAQRVSLLAAAGIGLVVIGTLLFIRESQQRSALAKAGHSTDGTAPGGARIGRGVMLAVGSGLFYALAGIFRQLGLDAHPSALTGASIGVLTALLVATVNIVRLQQLKECFRGGRRATLLFGLSGVASSVGMLSFFWALDAHATLAVATAFKNTAPLFTFFIVALFLRRGERVTRQLGLMVLIVVVGAVLVSLSRR